MSEGIAHFMYVRLTLQLLFLTLTVPSAWAEETSEPSIEVMRVTSGRVEKNILQLPASIQIIDKHFLESFQITDIQTLHSSIPSLSVSAAGGETQLYIRGIGNSSTGITSDPSVAIYLDGVYLPRAQYGSLPFIDIERIEVLKGPQGSLYGRNATGGVMNIISKSPDEEFAAEIYAGIGSFNYQTLGATVNNKVNENTAARLSVHYQSDDGYTKNIHISGSNNIDDKKILTVKSSILTNIGERSTLTVNFDHTDNKSHNQSIRPLDNLTVAVALGAELNTQFAQTRNDLTSYNNWQSSGMNVNLSIPFDNTTVNWISAYRDYQSDFLFNSDGTEIDISRTYLAFNFKQQSHSLTLQSLTSSNISWILGGQYLSEHNTGSLGLGRGTHPSFNVISFIIPNQNDVNAYSLFGQIGYRVNSKLKLTSGIRYSKEEKTDHTTVGGIFNDITGLNSSGSISAFTERLAAQSWSNLSPRFILTYTPSKYTNYYASLTEGFKSGGWSAYDTNEHYEPEHVSAMELGVKSTLFQHHQITASTFYYNYEDLQVSAFVNGLARTSNAAKASIKGIDLQGQFVFNTQLHMNYSAEWLDATYDEYLSTFGDQLIDVAGNKLINAPTFRYSTLLNYNIPNISSGELHIGLNVNYQSRTYHSAQNEKILSKPNLTLIHLNGEYIFSDSSIKLNFWMQNLTNQVYFNHTVRFTSNSQGNPLDINNIGAALGYPAAGRNIGLKITKRL